MANRVLASLFIAFSNLIVFAVLNGFQLTTQIPLSYINKWIGPGADYRDFYQGSLEAVPTRSSDLLRRRYSLFFNLPLALFQFPTAHLIFILLIPFSVLASCLLVFKTLKEMADEENNQFVSDSILVILFSYPVYFLFERGNIAAYYIPGIGLLLLMTGITVYEFIQLRQTGQKKIIVS